MQTAWCLEPFKRYVRCPLKNGNLCLLTEMKPATSSSYGSSLIWCDSQNLHPDLDDSVPSICQKAVADAFCVWRQIVEVKAAVSHQAQTGTSDLSELLEPVNSTLMALGKFNQMFDPFMNICIENLDRLSIRSRTSCGMSLN